MSPPLDKPAGHALAEFAGRLAEIAERPGPAARLTGGAPPAAETQVSPPQPITGRPSGPAPAETGSTEAAGGGPGQQDADESSDDTAPSPEVELTETEVADVLSGRVVPIGAFFGNSQQTEAETAQHETADVPGGAFLSDAGRIAASWARERHLGLTSASGICVALAVCSAAWLSAGTRADIVRGVAALWAGYLVLRSGQWLTREGPDVTAEPGSSASAAAWLAGLAGTVTECVVYAGLAIGATAEHWAGTWTLAIAVLSLVAVRNLMTACSTAPGFGEQAGGPVRRLAAAVLTMPLGGRILLVGVVGPMWGSRTALLALLDWSMVSVGYGIAGRAAADIGAWAGRAGEPRPIAARSKLVRLRDDGALSRAIGALVRGGLMPLPPAMLGVAAVAGLGFVGLHGLPGALLIAPAFVMLLAAPGAAHPHTGRFDWLVPVLLLGAQCLYITATGLAVKVPGAVIFALLGTLALRYTDLACPGRPVHLTRPRDAGAEPMERGTWLGWEGRMLYAGLTAAMGIAMYAYLILAAYLAVLTGTKIVTASLARQPDRRR